MQTPDDVNSTSFPWREMAARVLAEKRLPSDDLLKILRSPDGELLAVLDAAYRVRQRFFGNRMHLNLLVNARSGMCGEDCGYCSQSKVSEAPIPRHAMLSDEQLLDGAAEAVRRKAKTYCIVTSGRKPTGADLETIERVVPKIKERHRLAVCVSPGLLTPEEAGRLKACGVNRVNHNLNTSERFYPTICTTHTYQDRVDTLAAVRAAGLEICSGVLLGMGEEDEDVVEMALRLGELAVEALPVNFLVPIDGTPLAGTRRLDPRYCLKALAMFRLANPRAELRIAGGRERNLGSLQALGLFAANSIFVGDYLTTQGQPPEDDFRMIQDLGFEPVVDGASSPME
ncbi:MAG: biotin synthase BioB [Pirellulales bacterium]|nr:biotin synthase BioB [Pirellulales bacterium]